MKDDWNVNNLAKIEIYAIIHSRIFEKNDSSEFIFFVWRPHGANPNGHRHHGQHWIKSGEKEIR